MPTPKKNGRQTSKILQRKADLTRAKRILRAQMPTLREEYGVKTLSVFGSYVRGEQKAKSDLDVLIEFADNSLSLLGYIHLQNYLSDLLGVQVDLVERAMVKPAIGERILQEAVPI